MHTFDLDGTEVGVPAPADASWDELDGLDGGARHLSWSPDPEHGAFMVSAGTSPGFTADGMLAGEAQRKHGLRVESDDAAPLAGDGARRIAYRVTVERPRRLEAGGPAGHVSVPERTVEEIVDLLFVPGVHQNLRIGYRVEVGAPEELRSLFATMLDGVEVTREGA